MDSCYSSFSHRDAQTLVYQGHEYQRKLGVGKTNLGGSIPWRCSKGRAAGVQCKGSITQLASGDIRVNASHSENCPLLTREDLLNAQLRINCKKRSFHETTSLHEIYGEERAETIKCFAANDETVADIAITSYASLQRTMRRTRNRQRASTSAIKTVDTNQAPQQLNNDFNHAC